MGMPVFTDRIQYYKPVPSHPRTSSQKDHSENIPVDNRKEHGERVWDKDDLRVVNCKGEVESEESLF